MAAQVVVINPNSTQAVTDGIRDAMSLVPGVHNLAIDYVTLAAGPPGIETDDQVQAVVAPLRDLMQSHLPRAHAFVIACFSDPGVAQLREEIDAPVYGIGESAYRSAAADGQRFGVISIVDESVPRHRQHIERLGLAGQLAGDRPLQLSVLELADAARTRARLREVATTLREVDGAQSLILGCAGMAVYRDALQNEMGCPVIDPCQAAITAVLTAFGSELAH